MRSLVTRQHGLDDPPPQGYQNIRDTKIPGSETDPRIKGRRTQSEFKTATRADLGRSLT